MDERHRRQLAFTRKLYIVWAALGAVFAASLCYIIFLGIQSRAPKPVAVGQMEDFAPNTVTLKYVNADFFDPYTRKDFSTLPLEVVRDGGGNFTVFFARSTHVRFGAQAPRGCVITWNDPSQYFEESCGGARWTRDGKYLLGPAPRDLDRFPVQVSNGKLSIELQLIGGAPTAIETPDQ